METRTNDPMPELDAPSHVWRAYVERRIDTNLTWLREQRARDERRRRRLQRLTFGLLGRGGASG
jgi:hypothetical protein